MSSIANEGENARLKTFTEEDYNVMDPAKPEHHYMQSIGRLALHRLSPFKLSPAQIPTLADFMNVPWPKEGSDVDDISNHTEIDFGRSMPYDDPSTLASGISAVAGTHAAAVQRKVSMLLSSATADIKNLQWSPGRYVSQPGEELTVEAMKSAVEQWREELLAFLVSVVLEVPDNASPPYCDVLREVFKSAARKYELRPVIEERQPAFLSEAASSNPESLKPTTSRDSGHSGKTRETADGTSQNSADGSKAPTQETDGNPTLKVPTRAIILLRSEM